jgi:hypothetical protein
MRVKSKSELNEIIAELKEKNRQMQSEMDDLRKGLCVGGFSSLAEQKKYFDLSNRVHKIEDYIAYNSPKIRSPFGGQS